MKWLLPTKFNPENRKHIERLHRALGDLGTPNLRARDKARVGRATTAAVKKAQKRFKVPETGRLNQRTVAKLNEEIIKKRFSSKGQVKKLHTQIGIAARNAGLQIDLGADRSNRTVGDPTRNALRQVQRRYGLPAGGALNLETIERLESIVASRPKPVSYLKVNDPTALNKVRSPLRLNMRRASVNDAQRALAWAGFNISERDFNTRAFGKSTRHAVREFQRREGLMVTGEVDRQTALRLNEVVARDNSAATQFQSHHVRGSVRDIGWQGKGQATVEVFEKTLRGLLPLKQRKARPNGFFDIAYDPPLGPDGKAKKRVHLLVRVTDAAGGVVERTYHNVGPIHWANFTDGNQAYRGTSRFGNLESALSKSLDAGIGLAAIEESSVVKDVTHLRADTGFGADDVMKVSLAHRISGGAAVNALTPEVFYAFLSQNYPPELPSDLQPDTPGEWNGWVGGVTEETTNGIVFLEREVQERVLNDALAANVVSRDVGLGKVAILDAFEDLRQQFILEKPILDGGGNLKALLELVPTIPVAAHRPIADVFLQHWCGGNVFFLEVALLPNVTNVMVDRFRQVTELGGLAMNHAVTAAALRDRIDGGAPETRPQDFAKFTQADWEGVINGQGGAVPAAIVGNTPAERVATFAAEARFRAQATYPAVALMAEVGRTPGHGLAHTAKIAQVIDDNPDLDLRSTNLDKFVADPVHGAVPPLVGDELTEAKTIQRLHRIAPSSAAAAALLSGKLHSSVQIYSHGRERLVGNLQGRGVTRAEALQVFNVAERQYAKVLGLLGQYRIALHRDSPRAIQSYSYDQDELAQAAIDIPNLEVLFGSLDYCDCRHCQSVYSPAAYLTDLLRFLNEKDAVQAGKTALDVLLKRRPDLKMIKLSCENTETPLPYVDLVCEILENTVPPANAEFSYQTTLEAGQLRATSEYVREAAYNKLRSSKYPMNSSLNLWQEEARAYLRHLGVPRHKLMYTFQDRSDTANPVPSDASVAGEYFGISSKNLTWIVTPAATAAEQDTFWGFNDSNDAEQDVSTVLAKAKLHPDDGYDQLLELLQSRFVNPALGESLIERPLKDCDVGQQKLNNLTLAKLDRMHRFLRLWHSVDWRMWELDRLIRNPAVGNDTLDATCLENLHRIAKLQTILSLSTEDVSALFAPLSTESRTLTDPLGKALPSQYDQLFQNLAVTNPLNPVFALVQLNGVESIADHKATVQAGLFITEKELDLLLELTDGQLTLANLSVLFRYSKLSRAMRLSVEDLLILGTVTGIANPFDKPSTTLQLIEYHAEISDSGTSLRALEYILFDVPNSPIGLRDEVIEQWGRGLRTTLKTLLDEAGLPNDSLRLGTEKALGKLDVLPAGALIDRMLDLVEGQWVGTEPQRVTFITDTFGVFVRDVVVAIAHLTRDAALDENGAVARYDFVAQELAAFENASAVREHVASVTGLGNEHATHLLQTLRVPGQQTSLQQAFQTLDLTATDAAGDFVNEVTAAALPEVFTSYRVLHKVSALLAGVDVTVDDLTWVVANHAAIGVLDVNSLPVSGAAAVPFAQWRDWRRHLAFIGRFPEPESTAFRDVLTLAKQASTKADLFLALEKLTRWSVDDLAAIDGGLNLSHTAATRDYTKAETYARLVRCFDQIRYTGVDAATMIRWAKRDVLGNEKAIAREAREAAKSKYDEAGWITVVTPIQDDLRERKRSALTDYLIEHSQRTKPPEVPEDGKQVPNPRYWRTPADIHGYLLIDTEMSSCQLTSRIKQAMSSVQLFIQRCFLNLESRKVRVNSQDPDLQNSWQQWRWMKSYRIWEANRKVFLYPENWILPELRDDKTPFFDELEGELRGGEITPENVEAAFQSYLYKVEEVAHLEICGLYHEKDGPVDRMHVIGRTRGIPPVHYHRFYDLNYSNWSPWEKIDVEIAGDHVTPVVYNRKLHLFWVTFEEKPLKLKKLPPVTASPSTQEAPETSVMLQVRLGWTVKTHKGWSSKKVAKQKLIHPWKRPEFSYNLRPRYKRADNTLWVDVFLSTSRLFNDSTFYDQHAGARVPLTDVPFDETFRPWHASSFVFNGDLVDIKLRALPGQYYLPSRGVGLTNSYEFVRQNLEEEGGGKITKLRPHQRSLRLPEGMHFENRSLTNNLVHSKNASRLTVLDKGASKSVLRKARSPFHVVMAQQDRQLGLQSRPFVYQDRDRAFLVRPEYKKVLVDCRTRVNRRAFEFFPLYHPFARLFIRELNRDGIEGLFQRRLQTEPRSFFPTNNFDFDHYQPVHPSGPAPTAKRDIVDFSFGGAYSVYNWEVFFHAPLMIASILNQNQKFEAAMKWFHYIFDPTSTHDDPVPQRYWVTKPFYEHSAADYRTQRITNILDQISDFEDAVTAWKNDPFKPHLIARYRPVAYQRTVVMKYIDNLIDWGDQLFRRDSIESINEATLLYLLAKEILGDRPTRVPNVEREAQTYKELTDAGLDIFANVQVAVASENLTLPIRVVPAEPQSGVEPLPVLETSYFCIPNNDRLEEYWDQVADRLFKIRNCMNIEGVVRQLALFEPPIDPALLVKAAAAGVDFSSVLNDLNAPLPPYRFDVMIQQARRLVGEVRSLGGALLSALEKKDAEELAVLRSEHQEALLKATVDVRRRQIKEAEEQIKGLTENQALVEKRREYYASREYMNTWETVATVLEGDSLAVHATAIVLDLLAGAMHQIPTVTAGSAGVGGTAVANLAQGGEHIGSGAARAASSLYQVATALSKAGGMASTQGSYRRRADDWDFQAAQAQQELRGLDRQIAAAEIRHAIAEKELENLEQQIEQAEAEHDYLKTKYTNHELYGWMATQLSTTYFQSYELAYDVAKRAERCFQYELELQNSSYVTFGYWDSLRKGLLSGEQLALSLDRMDAAYRDQNRREFEITKRISLAEVAPTSLLALKYTGECTIDLPEWLFDMDYPGHYLRRVKSAGVTIPSVVGPYTSMNCTVSIETSEVRLNNLVGGQYARDVGNPDTRFVDQLVAVSSIATSHGQGDRGLFELRLGDERYLPFEGAGAIGRWKVLMPQEDNQFDFDAISDFVLTMQYTARDGGEALRTAARNHRNVVLPTQGILMLSLRHHFPTEWHRFLHPGPPGAEQRLELVLGPEHFPFFARRGTPKVLSLELALDGGHGGNYLTKLTLPNQVEEDRTLSPDPGLNGLHHQLDQALDFPVKPAAYGDWLLKIRRDDSPVGDFSVLPADDLGDAYLIVLFEA